MMLHDDVVMALLRGLLWYIPFLKARLFAQPIDIGYSIAAGSYISQRDDRTKAYQRKGTRGSLARPTSSPCLGHAIITVP